MGSTGLGGRVCSFERYLLIFAVAATFGLLTACGGSSGSGSNTNPTVNVVVTPSTANIIVGKSQAFTASVFGSSNTGVTWSVTEAGGGTVDSSGNYTAPMTAGTYHVVATSVANPADSGSAPAVVTVPQPSFTSVPSTTAAQDQPYSYALAATDPAGTTITYALTSAPTGAVLSGGNTITWTPTAQQARQNNGFEVTATTAAGGTATQSWTVAPTGTIQGSIFIKHWSADGSVGIEDNPVDQNYSWAALIPQSDGSLNVLPGTGYPDATFAIPNVPAGYYWLQFFPGDVVWTNASNLDYGADAIGHKQLPFTTQVIGCDITGMDPFDPVNHELILYSINAQAFELGIEDLNPGDPPPAPFPATGSTVCNADPTVSFTGGDFSAIEGISGISPSMGDVSTVSQFEAAPSDTLAAPFDQNAMVGPAVNEGLDIEGNFPFPFPTYIVPGALSDASPQSQDFNVTFSSWANAFNASGPGTAVPQAFMIFLSAQQQAAAVSRPHPNFSGASPNLVAAMALPSSAWPKDASGNNVWPQDGDMGTLNYNNPFLNQTNPSFANIYEMYVDAQYTIPLPGSATPMQPILEDFVWTPNAAGFTPGVQPVGNPQINGTTLFSATTVPTVTPTLTWNAPTADGSVVYDILICAPTVSTDCQPPSRLANQQTGFVYQFSQYSQTSFTVPPGILTPGTNYVFFIVAELRAGYDPLHPQRFSLPWGAAWTVSNIVTVSGSAAAGVLHGNRALITKRPDSMNLFGSQLHVDTKRPTFSGLDPRYVVPAPPKRLAPYPVPTTQK
jgi:hypothetical protein